MKIPSIHIMLLCLLLLNSCAPVSQKQYEKNGQHPLTTQQLEVQLKGKKIHLEAIDFDASIVFHENMTLTAKNQQDESDSGTWSLEDDNMLCLEFRSWYFGDRRCFRVFKERNKVLFFTPNGALSYTGVISNNSENIGQSDRRMETKKTLKVLPERRGLSTGTNNFETAKDRFIRLAQNCPDCNLSGVDLSNAQLNHANLAGANLSGADFTDANLRQANLAGANLSNAKLIRTNLPGANLSFADLTNADLAGSNLIRANMTGATTTNTNLTGAHLESIQGKIQ